MGEATRVAKRAKRGPDAPRFFSRCMQIGGGGEGGMAGGTNPNAQITLRRRGAYHRHMRKLGIGRVKASQRDHSWRAASK